MRWWSLGFMAQSCGLPSLRLPGAQVTAGQSDRGLVKGALFVRRRKAGPNRESHEAGDIMDV